MPLDFLFALRGLLSFVAFNEITTSARCLLPAILLPRQEQYIKNKLFSLAELESNDAERIVSHLYGIICLLNGITLLTLGIFAHYKPLTYLGFSFSFIKLLLLVNYAVFFQFIPLDDSLIFPLVSGFISIIAILAVPYITVQDNQFVGDENKELLRRMRKRTLIKESKKDF